MSTTTTSSSTPATEILNKSNEKRKRGNDRGSYRLNASQIFLTYAQCDIEPVVMLEFLKRLVKIEEYIIAQEKHKDGGLHLHCYLKLEKKVKKNKPVMPQKKKAGKKK